MFIKSKVAIAVFTTSMILASSVQAEEMSVEQFVSGLVSQAMLVARQELQYGIQESILNTTYAVSMDDETSYMPKVTITDIKMEKVKANTTQ